MKIGFFSPLPPARTGVADYSSALLSALKPLGQVDLNSTSADVLLYHLGNNRFHREIYRQALEKPGVVVLHDAVLHHFLLDSLNPRDYVAEFVYNYGAWSEDLARDLCRHCERSATDPEFFRYPMLKRVIERSLGVIVHNARAAAIVNEHVPGAAVFEIPHLFAPPPRMPTDLETLSLRHWLEIPSTVFLFGLFGYLRESKRIGSVLRAFHRARRDANVALLVAGEFVSPDLARSLEPLLQSEDGVLRVGYLDEKDFWRYAAAVDACINLRYPSAGETSGICIRLMGLGKPVFLTNGPEVSRFPEKACIRVDAGAAEEEMLAEYMVWLARFPNDARQIGQRAAAHIREFHAPARASQLYWQTLTACYHKS